MKKWISIIAIMALVFAMTSCSGSSGSDEPEEDGQNPVMNFVGNYVCDRADIAVEAQGTNEAKVIITWGGSAYETAEWVLSGVFDDEALIIEYHDCVKNITTFDENGDIKEVEEVYTGGHGFLFFAEGDTLTLTWQDDQEHVADGMTFTYLSPEEAAEAEETGMANPWSDVATAEEAAKGAGIDMFEAAEGVVISLGEVKPETYRCMEGIAEARIPIAAVDMTIRKGSKDMESAEGDISGDYGEYKYNWTQNIKGLEVKCFGNRKGEATKTIWSVDDYDYSITAFGAGGDDDFGLSADDLNSLINAIQ